MSGITIAPIRKTAGSNCRRARIELYDQIRDDGKPALIFASHLANWELPALAAPAHGLDAAILYRRPNIASADRIIQEMRQVNMGTLIPAGRDAPLRLAQALQERQARRHAGRPVSDRRRRGHLLRPQDPRQSDAGAPVAPGRMPDPRRPRHPQARLSLCHRADGRRFRRCATPTARSTSRARRRRSPTWWKAGCANIRSSGSGCIGGGGNVRPVSSSS